MGDSVKMGRRNFGGGGIADADILPRRMPRAPEDGIVSLKIFGAPTGMHLDFQELRQQMF